MQSPSGLCQVVANHHAELVVLIGEILELDKDRTEKACEYAVLVSLLEPESELYNSGIVDVSHRCLLYTSPSPRD